MKDKTAEKERSASKELTREKRLPKIPLTENQWKVIQDKYLKDAPSVEAWFSQVAHNIALAEILFHPDREKWGVMKGVKFTVATAAGAGVTAASSMTLLHDGLHDAAERDKNFKLFMRNLEDVASRVPEARKLVEYWEEEYYDLLSHFDFLPNSPTLMNAGRELQQLSACYVLPVDDSIEGISKALTAQSLIQKSGGGTGFSFQRLRPKGDVVKKTHGVASGAVSFMQIFDKMTDVVKQGGTRRGANMGILPYWHPEIKDFISMKQKAGVMENFNVSVAIDRKFIRAVMEDTEIDLINPRTKQPVGKQRAKEIFDTMVEYAWQTGDPGFVVLDRINESGSNPTPALGQIESTNPCGEQPLLPWEPCNLGSINLANFVEGPVTKGRFNYDRLARVVSMSIRFLDDVIDVNHYPMPEIERMAKGNRRIGLGVMGFGEMLVKMGIPFDSQRSLELAEEVMQFISDQSLRTSEELSKERGVFPNWKDSIYDPASTHFRGEARTPRNCARTTIAPTGTIAICAGLQGAGIEPFFGIAYTRYNAKALDALRNGLEPDAKDVFTEVNPLFKEVAKTHNYFGLTDKDLFKRIDANHKAVRGIPEIPEEIQKLFPTAHDVSVDFHVKIQAAFQKFTDNGVSKTINMPNSATVEDVRKAYLTAYEAGLKGITIYRDGCKAQQVLNLAPTGGAPEKKKRKKDTPAFGVSSEYYQIKTGYGPLHVHINYDENGPYQIFTNLPPLGTEISGLTSLIGILLSKYLEAGGDPLRIIKHLNSVKGDRPIGFGENRVNSVAHAVGLALRLHLKRTGQIAANEEESEKSRLELWEAGQQQYCPSCYSSNIAHESGCSGPTCHDCGYSECS